jgi:MFS family permease
MLDRLSFFSVMNRDARILVLTRALRSFSAAILSVSFTIYLSKLGASSVTLGIVFTGISLFSAVRSFLEGLVADRYGRKPILLYSACLMIIGGTIYALTRELGVLLATSVLVGIGGMLPYTPAEQAILTEKVSSEDRTMAFSINSFLGTLAGVFGSFAAGFPELLQKWGVPELASYKPIYVIYAFVGLITLVFFTVIEETVVAKDDDPREEVQEELNVNERRFLMKWSAVITLDMIGGSFINNFVPYWFYLRFGVGLGTIGTLFGVSRLFSAFSFILGYKLAERVGTIRATVMSRIPVVVINTLTPILPSYIIVASMRGFMSMFSMIDIPLRQSYLMGVVGSRRRASAAGIVSVVSRFTAAGAPILTGYFFEYVSTSLPFYIAASFQFLSFSLMYILFRNIKPPEEQ